MQFSQIEAEIMAARITLCRPVRPVRRFPRSAAHGHDFFELGFVRRGHYELMQPGRAAVRVEAGQMVLLPPGAIHYERYERGILPRVGWLGFSVPPGGRLAARLHALAGEPRPVPPENLELLADEIMHERAVRPPGWELKVAAAVTRLIVLLGRQPLAGGGRRRSPRRAAPGVPVHLVGQLMAAAHHLEEHCRERIVIAEFAAGQGLSPAYFAAQFRRHLGVSPRQYLITARLNLARRRLAEGALTHAAIAQECGFHDEAHFSRAFRALTGLPPRRYQRRAAGS